jgi:hypothetical protein
MVWCALNAVIGLQLVNQVAGQGLTGTLYVPPSISACRAATRAAHVNCFLKGGMGLAQRPGLLPE